MDWVAISALLMLGEHCGLGLNDYFVKVRGASLSWSR